VVLVVHEILGLTPWIRSVADQLAADGFIAIAPDLLTAKHLTGTPAEGPPSGEATAAIRTIVADVYQKQLEMIARYGMALPTALQRYGIVGFCWGGGAAYAHAVRAPANLRAAVAYYPGSHPPIADLKSIAAPVLGLYGANDARITATAPQVDSVMHALGKSFEHRVFTGAGHGFLRSQDTRPPDFEAATIAWPMTVAFLTKHLGQ
jgi:carboxymethylenebutenolidase